MVYQISLLKAYLFLFCNLDIHITKCQAVKISAASNLVFNLQKGIFGAQFPGPPLTDSHPHLPPTESHRHNLGTSSVPRMQWDLAPDSVANLAEEENDSVH